MEELTEDIRKKIELMLDDVKKNDPKQFETIMNTITEIYKENNSGQDRDIQKQMYNWISDVAQNKVAKR